ncbi:hypothetical protein LAV72_18570 [Lysinibacillus xylanilyticus]|uniref:hypothetical protein n=1 Tax=Lysinibacillus xylanilyticus TaxID=582475 RepID=UPI002B24D12C|nr:hypothetical protein [Lysinibacillus xylanilyticus]MEB2301611.1 hypothetical protein [Lysinibacillus xylanilyticus]
MDFDLFTKKMQKGQEPTAVNLQQDSIVYLFKVMLEDLYANEIDMSKFTLEDITKVLDLLETDGDFNEAEGLIEFKIKQLDIASNLSKLEVNLARNFLDTKLLTRKRKVTFI